MSAAFLRKREAAAYLSIAVRTLSDWQRRGIVPHFKPSRKVCLFAVADLDRAMRRFRIQAVGEPCVAGSVGGGRA